MSMKPALTPEEWVHEYSGVDAGGWPLGDIRSRPSWDGAKWSPSLHHLAAVALHGQPFGFTWEDLFHLRSIANIVDGDPMEPGAQPHSAEVLRDLADRIEALLPPREP